LNQRYLRVITLDQQFDVLWDAHQRSGHQKTDQVRLHLCLLSLQHYNHFVLQLFRFYIKRFLMRERGG
jgi:hypothetical protein